MPAMRKPRAYSQLADAENGHTLQPRTKEKVQRLICQLLGQFRTPKEIQNIVLKVQKVAISPQVIERYVDHPDWQPLIQLARAEYVSKVSEVPIANQVVRLERLELIYQRAMAGKDRKEAMAALEAARAELNQGKDGNTLNVYVNQHITKLSMEDLERRRQELLGKLAEGGFGDGLSQVRPLVPATAEETGVDAGATRADVPGLRDAAEPSPGIPDESESRSTPAESPAAEAGQEGDQSPESQGQSVPSQPAH